MKPIITALVPLWACLLLQVNAEKKETEKASTQPESGTANEEYLTEWMLDDDVDDDDAELGMEGLWQGSQLARVAALYGERPGDGRFRHRHHHHHPHHHHPHSHHSHNPHSHQPTTTSTSTTTSTITSTTTTTTLAPCPTNSTGNAWDGCKCNAGYAGVIAKTLSPPYYSGECGEIFDLGDNMTGTRCKGSLASAAESFACDDRTIQECNESYTMAGYNFYMQCGQSSKNCLALGPLCAHQPS